MIVLGVTGSIAAYKAAELASQLKQKSCDVRVIMTRRAREFVSPLTFEALTGQKVLTDDSYFDEPFSHIHLTEGAKLFVVAPATANCLAQLSLGLAGDVLTTTALAVACPLWVCPAMNPRMWLNAKTQEHCRELKKRGVRIIEPEEGSLACGHQGSGRMAEPEAILKEILESKLL